MKGTKLIISLVCIAYLWPLQAVRSPFGGGSLQDVDLGWVLETYPERVAFLFSNLDPENPGLEQVRDLAANSDYLNACRALIAYYREGDDFNSLRNPGNIQVDLREADRILADTFSFQGVTARQPHRTGGGLDWSGRGPRNDEEWANFLNRHEFLAVLLKAWRQSGDVRYAMHLNSLLTDWIISNPYPVEDECCPQWRTLNTAIRFAVWPAVFYGMQQSEAFSDATRILMLISVAEQGNLIRRFHWTHQNHALYELNGLARIGAYWPELVQADEWFGYAARHMLYEMEGQVLPDGVQDELTSMYHYYALRLFRELLDLAAEAGKSLPPALRQGTEKMYHYLAFTMRPDGTNVLNNDSDLSDYRPDILQAARQFGREDWAYIASGGEQGKPPGQLSVLFPYAGQVIMRNGWHRQAHWSYFDAGPHGTAHRHDDKLHLSVAAYGRDLLVDGGRYWYNADIWREYFVSSYSHNVVLVDGFGHKPDVNRYTRPDKVAFQHTDTFTYAQASFDAGFREVDDTVRHTRGVLYLKDRFWVVIDQLSASGSHTIQPLWHFHPSCRVLRDGNRVFTGDPDAGNLLIGPVGPVKWSLTLRHGPEEIANPEAYREWKPRPFDAFPIQGAYSERYNVKQASYVAVYNGKLNGELTFAWVLLPFAGAEMPVPVQAKLRDKGGTQVIRIREGRRRYRVELDLKAGRVLKLVNYR